MLVYSNTGLPVQGCNSILQLLWRDFRELPAVPDRIEQRQIIGGQAVIEVCHQLLCLPLGCTILHSILPDCPAVHTS